MSGYVKTLSMRAARSGLARLLREYGAILREYGAPRRDARVSPTGDFMPGKDYLHAYVISVCLSYLSQ